MVFQRDPGSQYGDYAPEQHHRTHALGGGDALTFDEIIEAPADGSILVAQSIGSGRYAYREYAISVPAANVRNALGVDNGETRPTWKTTLDATNPTTIVIPNTAAPGTSLIYAHRDHAHGEAAHDVLSAGHGDTLAGTVARGDVIYGNSTPKWARLAKPAAPAVLYNDATDAAWDTMAWTTPAFNAGDFAPFGGVGTVTVAAGDVTLFKYRLMGKTMHIAFTLSTITIARSGAGPQGILITIPAGKSASGLFSNALARLLDNGVNTTGWVQASGTTLQIFRTDLAQWANATDATYVYGEITIETS